MIIRVWKIDEKESVVLEEKMPDDMLLTILMLKEIIIKYFSSGGALVFLDKMPVPFENASQWSIDYTTSLNKLTEESKIDIIETSRGMIIQIIKTVGRLPLQYDDFFDESGNRIQYNQ